MYEKLDKCNVCMIHIFALQNVWGVTGQRVMLLVLCNEALILNVNVEFSHEALYRPPICFLESVKQEDYKIHNFSINRVHVQDMVTRVSIFFRRVSSLWAFTHGDCIPWRGGGGEVWGTPRNLYINFNHFGLRVLKVWILQKRVMNSWNKVWKWVWILEARYKKPGSELFNTYFGLKWGQGLEWGSEPHIPVTTNSEQYPLGVKTKHK